MGSLSSRDVYLKLLHLPVVIWLAVTLLFGALTLIQGNPIDLFVDARLTAEQVARLKEIYGYDSGPALRYVNYMTQLVQGEMGLSFVHNRPVVDVLQERAAKSLGLGVFAYLLGMFICFLLLVGRHLCGPSMRVVSTQIYSLFIAVPGFLFAIVFIDLFATGLGLFPAYGSVGLFADELSPIAQFRDRIHHAFLPALCIALPLSGYFTAYLTRGLDDLEQAPFIIGARGRGVSEGTIFWSHKLRQVRPMFIQLSGLTLPIVAGGAMVIEAVFGWSGMGMLMFDAAQAKDYPLLIGGCIWMALFVIPCYEMADWLRAREDQSGGGL